MKPLPLSAFACSSLFLWSVHAQQIEYRTVTQEAATAAAPENNVRYYTVNNNNVVNESQPTAISHVSVAAVMVSAVKAIPVPNRTIVAVTTIVGTPVIVHKTHNVHEQLNELPHAVDASNDLLALSRNTEEEPDYHTNENIPHYSLPPDRHVHHIQQVHHIHHYHHIHDQHHYMDTSSNDEHPILKVDSNISLNMPDSPEQLSHEAISSQDSDLDSQASSFINK